MSTPVYHGISIGHVVPEARLGGPIALVKDGDRIVVDSENRVINWLVDEKEQARRKQEWNASDKGQPKEERGVLFRYARDVAVSHLPTLILPVAERCLRSRPTLGLTPTKLKLPRVKIIIRILPKCRNTGDDVR